MNFPDAFSKLLQSEAIRRASWDETETIWVETDIKHRTGYHPRVAVRLLKRTNPEPYIWKTEDWVPDAGDLAATDWTTTTY